MAQYLFKERILCAAGILRFKTSPKRQRDLEWMRLHSEGRSDSEIARMSSLRFPQTKGRKTVEKAINRMKKEQAEWLQEHTAAMEGLGWTAPPGMTM
jgi:hypothetical protein